MCTQPSFPAVRRREPSAENASEPKTGSPGTEKVCTFLKARMFHMDSFPAAEPVPGKKDAYMYGSPHKSRHRVLYRHHCAIPSKATSHQHLDVSTTAGYRPSAICLCLLEHLVHPSVAQTGHT